MPVMTTSLYGFAAGPEKFYEHPRELNVSCGERESGHDESDSELEFITSHSSGVLAPFQPQRCSTPLMQRTPVSAGIQSFTEFGRMQDMHTVANDRVCLSANDYQLANIGRAARGKMVPSLMGTPNGAGGLRCLPVNNASSPVFNNKGISNNIVPDYNSTSSTSSLTSFSSCGGGRNVSPFRVASHQLGSMQGIGGGFQQREGDVCSSGDYRSMTCCAASSGTGSPLVSDFVRSSGGGRVQGGGGGGSGSGGGHGGNPVSSVHSSDSRWTSEGSVERQAQAYRLAASICVPNVVWSGILPARNSKGSAYSCKVFLGGVPWDITEANLNLAFGKFGQLKVEWPSSHSEHAGRNSKGYLYIIFDNERSVRALLAACTQDFSQNNRNYYFKVCSSRLRRKDVQVIPWQLADSTYVRNGCISAFGTKTVFVGSLHGMLNAEGLARIMDDLFGGVVAANVDTDKHKYPIGSGRVVFNCTHSYVKAIRAAFVELRTQKFSKKIQIDPFLEDSMCSICNAQVGPFFCRDMECFQYFCGTCWQWQHSVDNLKQHTPMMRNPRTHETDY